MRRCNKELQLDLRSSSKRFVFITLEIPGQFPPRYYLNTWLQIRRFLQGHENCVGLEAKGFFWLLNLPNPVVFLKIELIYSVVLVISAYSTIYQQPLWSPPPSSWPPSPLLQTGCRKIQKQASWRKCPHLLDSTEREQNRREKIDFMRFTCTAYRFHAFHMYFLQHPSCLQLGSLRLFWSPGQILLFLVGLQNIWQVV